METLYLSMCADSSTATKTDKKQNTGVLGPSRGFKKKTYFLVSVDHTAGILHACCMPMQTLCE